MALIGTTVEDRAAAAAEPQPAQTKPKHPLVLLGNKLDERRTQYGHMLQAAGISFDTFKAAAMTGINKNPDLITAEHASLFDALSQSCRDGLLPDGREGALVIHSTNVAKRGMPANWVNKVAWMPMVKGVLKKIRSAPGVASVHDGVVYKNDEFDFWIDDEGPHVKHRPSWDQSDKQDKDIIAVYALVRLTNGESQVEVVGRGDLNKMKQASKSGKNDNGPWSTWYAQMAKKGAWHRLAPKLPLPDDVMAVINRDEALYDFTQDERAPETDVTPGKAKPGQSTRLGALKAQHAKEPSNARQDEHASEHNA